MTAETTTRWHQRARTEWALTLAAGTSRHLLTRVCDESGLDFQGRPVCWRQIATFESYNDAEMVLRRLKAADAGGREDIFGPIPGGDS